MSVPLTATSVLRFEYVVSGLRHKLQTYMAYNDVLGQHQMVDRDGITTILWTTGAQYLWDKVRALYYSGYVTSPATVTLLHRSGTLWNIVDVAALTGTGSNGTVGKFGAEGTWTLRDTSFKKLKYILLEAVFDLTGKYPTGIGAGSAINAMTNALNGVDTDASAPFRWVKSRGDRFLAASGTVAGLSFRPNDAICRARGI